MDKDKLLDIMEEMYPNLSVELETLLWQLLHSEAQINYE